MQAVLDTVYQCLPPPTFSGSDLPCGGGGGESKLPMSEEVSLVDRITFLPDGLRHNIVSRLPIRDAVRTRVLSRHWRQYWSSTPLHLDDAHLLRSKEDQRIQRVSRILLAHPGPFRSVRLIFTSFDHHPAALQLWLSLLATKSVEDLVLVNQPLPVDTALPIDIMRCTSLRRLYLGFFSFPNITKHLSDFSELTELGLYCMVMTSRDLSYLLRISPVLKKLSIVASYGSIECINVRAHKTLCALVIWSSAVKEICIQNSEHLERVVMCNITSRHSKINITIDHAPKLCVLGYLEPGLHSLVIGNNVIQVGMKTSPCTMVPSVQVLGLRVPFEDKQRSRLLPAFLKCFPNVDTLHIESTETNEPNGKLNLASWLNKFDGIACVDEHVKRIFMHNFRGERNELAFLKFLFENARVLEVVVIILSEDCLTQINGVWDKLDDLGSSKWANENARLLVTDYSSPLSFEMAMDLSMRDPFCSINDLSEQLQQQVGLAEKDVEPTVMLSSGHRMPVVGLDVWQMVSEMKQHNAFCDLMNTVIAMGYRHFDCTFDFDTEVKIGEALAEACKSQLVERNDLFIAIKLPDNNSGNVIETCKRTVRNLQLDYVDLYLVNVPDSDSGDSDTRISLEGTWHALEELVSMGLVNSIGICNCDIFLIRDLLAYAKTKPAVSQIKIHPYLQRDLLVKFCQTHKLCVVAHNPDSEGLEPFLKDPVIKQ
ncbi:unnamed protein product [Urochloa humidicola]